MARGWIINFAVFERDIRRSADEQLPQNGMVMEVKPTSALWTRFLPFDVVNCTTKVHTWRVRQMEALHMRKPVSLC